MAFRKKDATVEAGSKLKLITVTAILQGTSHLLISARNEDVKDSLPGSKVTKVRPVTDELTDREEAETRLYKDKDGHAGLPADNVWYALMEAGKWLPYNRVQKTVTKADGATVLPVLIPELIPQSTDERGDDFFLFTDVDGKPADVPWIVRREIQKIQRTGGCLCVHIPTFKAGEWYLAITFQYNPNFASPELIKDLFNFAGLVAGFGQNRPGKGGRRGKFKVIKWIGFPEEKKKKEAKAKAVETEATAVEGNGETTVETDERPTPTLAEAEAPNRLTAITV